MGEHEGSSIAGSVQQRKRSEMGGEMTKFVLEMQQSTAWRLVVGQLTDPSSVTIP